MRKFKRLTMTLALLIMAVGGAWAQSSLKVVELEEVPAGWENDQSYLIAGDLPGFKAVTLDEAKAWKGAPKSDAALLFYAFDGEGNAYYVAFDNGAVLTDSYAPSEKDEIFINSKSMKFYYTGELTEWDLTSKDGKNWILDKMPASNIELQVEYFAESNLFLSKEAQADKGSISVKAGDLGVQFGNNGKSANTVTEGSPMTVTYNGTKKLLGMKVAKKAPAEGHALSASAVGEIVGSDGKAYAVEDKDNLPEGVTAVAMVASKNGSNGLAIQLNSSPVEKTWAEAKTYAEGLTAVPGGTWRLPSMADWQTMFVGCAVTGDAGVSDFMDPIAGFNAKIAATGIEWVSYNYWSSSGANIGAWYVFVSLGGTPYAAFYENETSDEYKYLVLGCLFF